MKKAQAWGIDLCFAMTILLVGIIVFYIYAFNYSNDAEEELISLDYEGNLIMTSLLSEGYPETWNSGNVEKIGLLSGDKINQTKLDSFYDMAVADYENTKELLNTKYDYYFFTDGVMYVNSVEIGGVGKPGTDKNNIPATSLIKITRFSFYNDKPVTVYLYIWEEE